MQKTNSNIDTNKIPPLPSDINHDNNLKFYTQRAVAIATFIGGPLATGYLLRANYLKLNQPKEGRNALLISIIATFALFMIMFMIPESIMEKLPNTVIPVIYTFLAYFITDNIHGNVLSQYKEEDGEFYSNWKAAGIGLLSSLILVIGLFISIFLLTP